MIFCVGIQFLGGYKIFCDTGFKCHGCVLRNCHGSIDTLKQIRNIWLCTVLSMFIQAQWGSVHYNTNISQVSTLNVSHPTTMWTMSSEFL